jgi:hypothetical protein
MGRKAPRKRLACRVISAFTRVFDARWRAARVFRRAPKRLSALRPPLDSGWRSEVANPGRKNAPRERDGLFDIVRRSAGAVAAHFGETNPTNPTRVVLAHSASKTRVNALMLGTHNHGLWLWVPALRPLHGRRPGRRPFIKNEKPTCGCGKRSPAPFACFRIVIYNGWRNSNVSSRQCAEGFRPCPGRCWLTRSGVDNLRQSASGGTSANDARRQVGGYNSPRRRPPDPNELWRPSLSHPRGTKKAPGGLPRRGSSAQVVTRASRNDVAVDADAKSVVVLILERVEGGRLGGVGQ